MMRNLISGVCGSAYRSHVDVFMLVYFLFACSSVSSCA